MHTFVAKIQLNLIALLLLHQDDEDEGGWIGNIYPYMPIYIQYLCNIYKSSIFTY